MGFSEGITGGIYKGITREVSIEMFRRFFRNTAREFLKKPPIYFVKKFLIKLLDKNIEQFLLTFSAKKIPGVPGKILGGISEQAAKIFGVIFDEFPGGISETNLEENIRMNLLTFSCFERIHEGTHVRISSAW